MEKEQVIQIFNDLIVGKRNKIVYSKGYKMFDETYEAFSKYFPNLKKETNKGETRIWLKKNF